MQNLSTTEITKYLKNIVDLECFVHRQNQIIDSSEKSITLRDVVKREVTKPTEPMKVQDIGEEPKETKYKFSKLLWIGTVVCFVVSLLLLMKNNTVLSVIIGSLFLFGVFCCIGDLQLSKEHKIRIEKQMKEFEKKKAENEQLKNAYPKKMEQFYADMKVYNAELLKADQEYAEEKQIAEHNYSLAKDTIINLRVTLRGLERTLESLYNFDIIFPKYRNMIAICTIYEYFASGRCSELGDAYNLYESELRQNMIIDNLNTIISQLESIKNNQFILYNEMIKTNSLMKDLSYDIKKVVQSTQRIESINSVIAQQNAVIAKNTEVIKYIALING